MFYLSCRKVFYTIRIHLPASEVTLVQPAVVLEPRRTHLGWKIDVDLFSVIAIRDNAGLCKLAIPSSSGAAKSSPKPETTHQDHHICSNWGRIFTWFHHKDLQTLSSQGFWGKILI